jgi:hypothetical protein
LQEVVDRSGAGGDIGASRGNILNDGVIEGNSNL